MDVLLSRISNTDSLITVTKEPVSGVADTGTCFSDFVLPTRPSFKMPLPNYGYHNKEDRKKQELVFEMAPEWVDVDENKPDYTSLSNPGSRKNSTSKRAQITTGKLGINLERKMVIDGEKDKEIWRKPFIDPQDLADAKRFSNPNRRELRSDVKSTLDSLISGDKLREVRSGKRPTMDDTADLGLPSHYGSKPSSSLTQRPSDRYERRSSSNRFSSTPSPRTSLTDRTKFGQEPDGGAVAYPSYGNTDGTSYKGLRVTAGPFFPASPELMGFLRKLLRMDRLKDRFRDTATGSFRVAISVPSPNSLPPTMV
eukprot:maker-scaffold311_size212931-snap-gene-0.7 protein:Tk00656 transcript:maker-scaffold311_size212931-snap-gene-0.7-mRNA-1 annotation:"family transcriptional regulator"